MRHLLSLLDPTSPPIVAKERVFSSLDFIPDDEVKMICIRILDALGTIRQISWMDFDARGLPLPRMEVVLDPQVSISIDRYISIYVYRYKYR